MYKNVLFCSCIKQCVQIKETKKVIHCFLNVMLIMLTVHMCRFHKVNIKRFHKDLSNLKIPYYCPLIFLLVWTWQFCPCATTWSCLGGHLDPGPASCLGHTELFQNILIRTELVSVQWTIGIRFLYLTCLRGKI